MELKWIENQTSRDGDALKEQASEGQFTITLFIIAMLSIAFGVYTMVMSRRLLKGEEIDESDQTAEVLADIDAKKLPVIDMNLPPPPGLVMPPPTGLVMPPPNASLAIPAPPVAEPKAEDNTKDGADDSRGEPPIPPSGLPDGWSQDQWNHFGWQYLDALNS
jgi:hypothetical protein